jgi:hypothetical protein
MEDYQLIFILSMKQTFWNQIGLIGGLVDWWITVLKYIKVLKNIKDDISIL